MAGLHISNRQHFGYTMVPDSFIDRFLASVNGEFIKVYLLLLRMARGDGSFSVLQMADALEITEKDVVRALKFWEKQGLIEVAVDENGISGVALLDADQVQPKTETPKMEMPKMETPKAAALRAKSVETEAVSVKAVPAEPVQEKKNVKQADLHALYEDMDFSQLLFITGRYTGKNLAGRDLDVLANLYSVVGMSCELLEYCVEYCVENGHKSMRYIETVALNWHEKGITTVEQAKEENVMGGKNTYAVLKAFGINGRNPAPAERKIIDKWFREYGFSPELVTEACNRTMKAIHQPSFEYADRILSDWRKLGVKELSDIERLDVKNQPKETAASGNPNAGKEGKRTVRKAPVNKFRNFSERNYDADAMMKQIMGMK